MAGSPAQAYRGPVCPRCSKAIAFDAVRDGDVICPHCERDFEARVFQPPRRIVRVAAVDTGVESATPCANHPRNAAVASCERCGIFVCSLCELEIGGSRYCPSCFDRLSQEGTLPTAALRFRDYASLSLATGLGGLLMSMIFGIPLGILAIYYAVRGFKDPNTRESRVRLGIAITLAAGDVILGGFFLFAFVFAVGKH